MDIQKYIWCFIIGGIICSIGQILIDKTKLTSARILVLFVTAGAILTGLGLYEKVVDLGGAGATVPLTGFGYSLAKGTMEAIDENGFIGIFTGGIKATAGGISAAILFGFMAALLSKPRIKEQLAQNLLKFDFLCKQCYNSCVLHITFNQHCAPFWRATNYQRMWLNK